MRILFILPSLTTGGLERVQVTVANSLVNRGHDITIMTYSKGDDLVPELDRRVKFIYKDPKPFPIRRKMKYIWAFYDEGRWETRTTPKKLYEYYIGNEKYDVEIAFYRGLPVKIISGSINKDSIKIAWVHNDYMLCGGNLAYFKSFSKVKMAYKKFSNIVCVSEQAVESFKKVFGLKENIVSIYNPLPVSKIIELSKDKIEAQKKSFTVIFVGRLVEQKGVDRLLDAVNRLNRDGLDFIVQIVGDGPERHRLQEYVHENHIQNVIFLGKQPNPYKYISNADLLVCSSYFEGYNLTIAEALILSIPVLSTKCTGPNEILDNGKYGMLVDNSAEGLYKGLMKIIVDKDLYSHYKIAASKRLDFFSEDMIIRKIESLFLPRI